MRLRHKLAWQVLKMMHYMTSLMERVPSVMWDGLPVSISMPKKTTQLQRT